jgi:hypothetical protein
MGPLYLQHSISSGSVQACGLQAQTAVTNIFNNPPPHPPVRGQLRRWTPTTDEARREKLRKKKIITTTRNSNTHTPPEHTGLYVLKNCKPFEISNARKQIVIIKVHRHFFVSLMMAL